jgi:AcrR family transcriptional regulator
MPNTETAKTAERILAAATELFSKMGYNGVSTRDIARVADVNETSIYRYYPRKRDLFVATLETEFCKIRLRADLISELAAATDSQAAIRALFQVIMEAILQQRALMRLLHFSVLEFGGDLDEVYQRHLRNMLETADQYFARWPELTETRRFDARMTILAFVSTIVALQDFYPVLAGEQLSTESLEELARTCASIWHGALAGGQIQTGSVAAHA